MEQEIYPVPQQPFVVTKSGQSLPDCLLLKSSFPLVSGDVEADEHQLLYQKATHAEDEDDSINWCRKDSSWTAMNRMKDILFRFRCIKEKSQNNLFPNRPSFLVYKENYGIITLIFVFKLFTKLSEITQCWGKLYEKFDKTQVKL